MRFIRQHKNLFFIAASLLSMVGCMAGIRSEELPPGESRTIKLDIRESGFRRSYLAHLPRAYDGYRKMPLVVVLHGAFETGESMERITGFSDLADEEDFIVIYPNGIGLFGFLQHWNAGHCCGKAQKEGVDDVGFLEKVLRDAQTRFRVDPNQVYLVGESNGAMLAYLFAAMKPEILSGLAVNAGAIGSGEIDNGGVRRIPAAEYGLPLLVIHGLDDETLPYEGGPSPNYRKLAFTSVADAVDFWKTANRCLETVETDKIHQGRVHVHRWSQCDYPVVLYTIENWGHYWPGLSAFRQVKKEAEPADFDAAKVIWRFFQNNH